MTTQTATRSRPSLPLRSGRTRRARAVLAAVAGLLGAACGEPAPAPARVRLLDCAGTLHAVLPAAASEFVHEDFLTLPGGWSVMTDQRQPLVVDPDALHAEVGREGERSFLTLSGKAGAFYRVLAVEPGTVYAFRGELRARGVQPRSSPFFGATFWLGELAERGTPEELFRLGGHADLRHGIAGALGHEGWQERRLVLRTAADTHSLIFGCVLAVNEALEGGAVDFARVRLARADERELWEFEAAAGVARAHLGEDSPSDWRARRSLAAMLGAEARPALLLLPGETLALELEVPADSPVLESALAPWPVDFRRAPTSLVFRARVEEKELLHQTLALAAPLASTAWREVSADLSAYAGRRVKLELSLEGPEPGLFGAPVVRPNATPHGADASDAALDLLLISIDTLRADKVGAYGATSGATPRLDAFARTALVFEDVTASAPYTLPAHATLFSGQLPSVHAVQRQGFLLSARRSPILARALAARGYRTQAFTAAGFLVPDFGFAQGFDGFSIVDPLRHAGSQSFADLARTHPDQLAGEPGEPGVVRVSKWLEAHAHEPFFAFVHTYEVHDYDPPPSTSCAAAGCKETFTDFRPYTLTPKRLDPLPGTPEQRAHVGHLYDAALRHVDGEVGELLDALERLDLAAHTVVVVTSDHGEELFERGHLQHGKSLYPEVLHVPLLVRIPGQAPRRIATPCMQADIAPTLCAALGLAPDVRMQGIDLLDEKARARARPIWSEVDEQARLSMLRDGGWTIIHSPPGGPGIYLRAPEWELYDSAHDPAERLDRAPAEPERLEHMQIMLGGLADELQTLGQALGPPENGSVDDETQELLRKLGYF